MTEKTKDDMQNVIDEVRTEHVAKGNPVATVHAARIKFRMLSGEEQKTVVKKLDGVIADWWEAFAQFEHDQREKAAQIVTELAAEYGEDVIGGALIADCICMDEHLHETDSPVVTPTYEKWTAEINLNEIVEEVAADMAAVKAQAAAEESATA